MNFKITQNTIIYNTNDFDSELYFNIIHKYKYEVDCITKTSSPLTFSSISTKISISANLFIEHLHRGFFKYLDIASDKSLLLLQETIFIFNLLNYTKVIIDIHLP